MGRLAPQTHDPSEGHTVPLPFRFQLCHPTRDRSVLPPLILHFPNDTDEETKLSPHPPSGNANCASATPLYLHFACSRSLLTTGVATGVGRQHLVAVAAAAAAVAAAAAAAALPCPTPLSSNLHSPLFHPCLHVNPSTFSGIKRHPFSQYLSSNHLLLIILAKLLQWRPRERLRWH